MGAVSLPLLSSDAAVRLTDRARRVMGYYCVFAHGESQFSPTSRLVLSLVMASLPATAGTGADPELDRVSVCSRSLGKPPEQGAISGTLAGRLSDSAPPRT